MDFLVGQQAEAIVATGERHLNGHEDIAFITIYFPQNIIAHINVNWLSPVKVRTTLIGGQKKKLVWDDLEAGGKIKVYGKGVEMTPPDGVRQHLLNYCSGRVLGRQRRPS